MRLLLPTSTSSVHADGVIVTATDTSQQMQVISAAMAVLPYELSGCFTTTGDSITAGHKAVTGDVGTATTSVGGPAYWVMAAMSVTAAALTSVEKAKALSTPIARKRLPRPHHRPSCALANGLSAARP